MILVSGFLNTKYKNLIIFSLKKKPPVDTCLRYWLDYYQICWRKKKLMYLHNFFYYSTYYINFPLAPVIHKYASINILNLIKYFLIENCPFSNYKRNIKSIIKKRVKGLGGWLLFECLKHQIVTRMRFLLMHACAAHAELLQYPDCLLIINKRGSPWSQEKTTTQNCLG